MESNFSHNTQQDLQDLFDTLDLRTNIRRALNYLSVKIPAENIFWLLSEEAEKIREKGDKFKFKSRVEKEVAFAAQSQFNLSIFLKSFMQYNLDLEVSMSSNEKYYQHYFGKERDVVIPVLSKKNDSPLAYIILKNLQSNDEGVLHKAIHIVDQMRRHLSFCIEHYKVREKSYIDDVTALYNQRYLPMVLDNEIARAKRSQTAFAVLFLDIDYFKTVNDTCGHLVGSKILVDISEIIQSIVRSSDYAFRYGGDEFVIVLTQTDAQKALVVAERIRKAVEATSFKIEGGPADLKLTVSVGLAGYPEHATSSSQIIQLADDAMYLAKHKSRNTVYVTAS